MDGIIDLDARGLLQAGQWHEQDDVDVPLTLEVGIESIPMDLRDAYSNDGLRHQRADAFRDFLANMTQKNQLFANKIAVFALNFVHDENVDGGFRSYGVVDTSLEDRDVKAITVLGRVDLARIMGSLRREGGRSKGPRSLAWPLGTHAEKCSASFILFKLISPSVRGDEVRLS